MPIARPVRVCARCNEDATHYIEHDGTIYGWACTQHWQDIWNDVVRRANAQPGSMRFTWLAWCWAVGVVACLGYALFGLRLEWLPLFLMAELPLARGLR